MASEAPADLRLMMVAYAAGLLTVEKYVNNIDCRGSDLQIE